MKNIAFFVLAVSSSDPWEKRSLVKKQRPKYLSIITFIWLLPYNHLSFTAKNSPFVKATMLLLCKLIFRLRIIDALCNIFSWCQINRLTCLHWFHTTFSDCYLRHDWSVWPSYHGICLDVNSFVIFYSTHAFMSNQLCYSLSKNQFNLLVNPNLTTSWSVSKSNAHH